MNIIDRRPNPKGKSLTNRQRFIDRARSEVREALADALEAAQARRGRDRARRSRSRPAASPSRCSARPSRGGKRDYVVPGNKKFVAGDRIERPQSGGGGGRGNASPDDGGEQDAFEFVLSKDEFLDLFFEDLELPDLIKTRLKESEATQLARAGFSIAGTPANLNLVRTMRNSLARRISLHRPRPNEIEALERQTPDRARCRRRRGRGPGRLRSRERRSAAPAASPISIPSTCATIASSACPGPTPRR